MFPLDVATRYVGYTAMPNRKTSFGDAAGHPNQVWDGAFLDFCLREVEIQVEGVSFTDTTAALAVLTRKNRLFKRPKVGDLVFFAFGTSNFSSPHVGIVTEMRDFRKTNAFKTIEAQVSTGLARGPQEENGVFTRTRYGTDVLSFARPTYVRRVERALDERTATVPVPVLRLSDLRYRHPHANVTHLQLALAEVSGLRYAQPGTFDTKTRSALADFQRSIGRGSAATGLPDQDTLDRLADVTDSRYFRVSAT